MNLLIRTILKMNTGNLEILKNSRFIAFIVLTCTTLVSFNMYNSYAFDPLSGGLIDLDIDIDLIKIDFLDDIFGKPLDFIISIFLDIIEFFMDIIYTGIEDIINLLIKVIITDLVPNITRLYNDPFIKEYMMNFIYIGNGVLLIITLYALIKSMIQPLGYEGDTPLNTLISFIVFFVLVNSILQISIGIITFQNNIVDMILEQISDNYNLMGVIDIQVQKYSDAGSIDEALPLIAEDLLRIILFLSLLYKLVELGARIVMRIVLILFIGVAGSLFLAVGVLKSQRNVAIGWLKSFITANIIYIFTILFVNLLILYFQPLGEPTFDFRDIVIVIGLLYIIDDLEAIVGGITSGMLNIGSTEGLANALLEYRRKFIKY